MPDTLNRVTEVFREVFNDNDLDISLDTSAKDISEWDSIMHISLIINVEKEFGVRLNSTEVAGLQSVGDLVRLVDSKVRLV
jgi:acyl carrier protein